MPIRPATHRASGQAKRAALLQAAIDVVAEKGIAGATHRAVATRAGVPLSTTSYFFTSIDDLMAAAFQVVADRAEARVEERIESLTGAGLNLDDTIDRLVDLLVATPQRDVAAQFEMYLESARRPELRATAHQLMDATERSAEFALGKLGIANTAARARLVVATLDGLALHRQARPSPESDRELVHDALHALVESFLAADAKRGSGDGESRLPRP
ncbi:TetR family transcriptional regulator [Gordonia spumicola]|uniref:TetR family transcriptional regulator n=1 Tax=Gordonia spumicola TaxID=589161 RepID=A0A7I9VE75_9ACTN|nr:TetR family transcriptional regulator [Gordonia spumicola]GEE03461.1 TetR family transcriptional regulator [Gordonia spumicola]